MAKTTKGKGKKTPPKGQKKQPSETQKEATPSTSRRSSKFECQFCGKSITTAHNLKVHEIHCRSKVVEKDKKEVDREIQSAIRKLKDEFEDQRDLIQKEASEREDMLKKELDELKEIMRLEIKMGHHGSPPQEKVEEPVNAEPPPQSQPAIVIEEPISQSVDEPEPKTIVESEPVPATVEKPLSIAPTPVVEELLPTPTPTPVEIPAPEPQPIAPPQVTETTTPEPHIPTPVPVTQVPSISREAVMELLKEEMDKLGEIKTQYSGSAPSKDVIERLEKLEDKINSLSSDISRSKQDSNKMFQDLERLMEKKLATVNPKRIDREIEKVSERVFDIMDEVGFGESMNVAKIPPNILEIVYKATLEDVVREMSRSLGEHEAEKQINSALEEVRLKTSGSELFRYDGRSIVTENLARSLETHMISAKQIQTTYSELLLNLLTTVPHYKSKNFQAMIKIKSQEYAVDKATILSGDVETIRNNMNNMGQMIAAFSSQLSAKAMKLEGEIKQNQESLEAKSDKADMESIMSGMMERAEAQRSLSGKLTNLTSDLDSLKELVDGVSKGDVPKKGKPTKTEAGSKDKDDKKEKDTSKTEVDGQKPDKKVKTEKAPSPEKPKQLEKDKKTAKPKPMGTMVIEDDVDEIPPEKEDKAASPKIDDKDKKILDALGSGNSSKTAIQKASGLGKKEVENILASLVKAKQVSKKGPKNRPTYSLVELKSDKKEKKPAEPKVKEPEPAPAKQEDAKPAKKGKKETKKPASKSDPEPKKEDKASSKPKAEEKPKDKKEKEAKAEDKVDKKPDKKPAKQVSKEPEKEAEKKEEPDAPPSKTIEELDEAEAKVYGAIPENGITLPNLKKSVEKDVKYTMVLRALRVLLDSNLVESATKGRHTLYQKINVKKMDETGTKKDKQEVK